jgi:hypothetical protein
LTVGLCSLHLSLSLMSLSSLSLRATTRLQQTARTSTPSSYRRITSIQIRTYSKITTNMGAQKTDTREGYAQTPLNTIKVYKHRGKYTLSSPILYTRIDPPISQLPTTTKPSIPSSPPPSFPTSPSYPPTRTATQHQ